MGTRSSSGSTPWWNGHDVDVIQATMTDDVVMEDLLRKAPVGQPHQEAMMARRHTSAAGRSRISHGCSLRFPAEQTSALSFSPILEPTTDTRQWSKQPQRSAPNTRW